MKTIKTRFIYTYLNIIIWIVLYFVLNDNNAKAIGQIATLLLIINAAYLIKRTITAKNSLLLVVFTFMSLYIWPAKLFFFDNLYFSRHNMQYTYNTAAFITLLFLLFIIAFTFFVKIERSSKIKEIRFRKNDIIFYGLYIISFFIILFFRRSGSHYDGNSSDVQVSPLYEYNLILLLTIYIYTNNEKKKQILFNALCSIYVFFTIIVGGRIEVILLGFILLAIKYQYIISFKKIIFFLFIGIWCMSTFESIRRDPLMIFTSDVIEIINPFKEKVNPYNSQVSNEGDVLWASERMIVLLEENIIQTTDRVKSAFLYFISPYVPFSKLPPIANLANYKTDIYSSGGGGLAIAYFYVMFGLLGVIGLAYFLSRIIYILYKGKTFHQFYALLAIMTFARWFVYNPIHIIKFCIWGVFFFYMVISLDYTIKKCRFLTKKNNI